MTTSARKQFSLGTILIVLGIFVFLVSTGLLSSLSNITGSLLFFALATIFLRKVRQDRSKYWWALIPGFTLLGLGAAAMAQDAFAGGYFLAITGVGFAMIYLLDDKRWWALIPAGALATLGLVATLDEMFSASEVGGAVFFLGLAATFGMLYILPKARGRQSWALYPAIAAAVLAMFSVSFVGGPLGTLWPLLLIGVGVYLLLGRNGSSQSSRVSESDMSTEATSASRALPAAESDNSDTGNHDAGSNDANNRDAGNYDAGNYDAGNHDAGNHDEGHIDPGDLRADDQLRKLSS